MKKIRLGRTNLEVTRWGLGGIPLSTIMGGTTEEVIAEVITAALDYGINYIDTSRVYMDSETNLGLVLKDRRKDCIIASKSYSRTYDEVRSDLDESLTQLQTDHIEILQVHALYPHEVAAFMAKGGGMDAFRKAKQEGVIDFIGLTSHHISVLVELAKTGEFDTVMYPFNVIERAAEHELLALARSLDIGSIVMKPIAGGAIRNTQKAFRFFNAYPVDLILNGVASVAQFKGNIACAEIEEALSPEELAAFEQEVAPLGTGFCRRCGYCMPCPNDIRVPDMVHIFYQAVQGIPVEELPPERVEVGKGLLMWMQACEGCGKCEERCPYNLPTRKRIQELIEKFS